MEMDNYANVAQMNHAAQLFLETGDFNKTIQYCQSAVDSGVKGRDLYACLAKAKYGKEEFSDAFDACLTGIELFPEDAEFYAVAAEILMKGKADYVKAWYYIEQAVSLDAENGEYRKLQVTNLIYRGHIKEAEKEIEAYVTKNPADEEFKKQMSAVMVSYAQLFYDETEEGVRYFRSAASVSSALYYCRYALDLYDCEENRVQYFAVEEKNKKIFNQDNMGGVVVLVLLGMAMGAKIFPFVFLIALFLTYFSYKPAWLIEKMRLMKKRDLANLITHVFSGALVFICKVFVFTICLIKNLFQNLFHGIAHVCHRKNKKQKGKKKQTNQALAELNIVDLDAQGKEQTADENQQSIDRTTKEMDDFDDFLD